MTAKVIRKQLENDESQERDGDVLHLPSAVDDLVAQIDRIIQNYEPHWHHDGDDVSTWQPVICPQTTISKTWRDDDATQKQLNYLRHLGHDAKGESLTKGMACDLIGQLKGTKNPSP